MTRSATDELKLFVTSEYDCGYLPPRQARNVVADPAVTRQSAYDKLIAAGFRRSGDYVYRPYCSGCNACRSLRVPSERFQPSRAQRRCRERNRDLTRRWLPADYRTEHFDLFERYVKTRHPGGGMDDTSPEAYAGFVTSEWCNTVLLELRVSGELLAVAVADRLHDGMSAVYSFFEPSAANRGLGNYAIFCLLEYAAAEKLPWVYLGYWIDGCNKMAYKSGFRPHQVFAGGHWHWRGR